jgi:predicted PurR-regulated permease PerM
VNHSHGAGEGAPAPRGEGEERAEPGRSFAVPRWAADAGRWSWIIIGALILLVALLALAAATRVLVVSALFAVLLGGTFLPTVDWFARHRLKRWMGALLVAAFLVALGIGIALVIV